MSTFVCDGCGLAASAEHIAERIGRLEQATRFRPIHIQALFVAKAPGASIEHDYARLLDALNIPKAAQKSDEEPFVERLTEFQRRGFCLINLTECPIEEQGGAEGTAELCERMGSTLVRRIQFSYRPKQIVLLSKELSPLVAALNKAGLADKLVLNGGAPLELPGPGASGKPSAWDQLLAQSMPAR